MAVYNIYAGLITAKFQYSAEFNSQEAADEAAWEAAQEIFNSYSGVHGIDSWEDILLTTLENAGIDPLIEFDCESIDEIGEDELYELIINTGYKDNIHEVEAEAVNNWIGYHAILAAEDRNQND